MKLRLAMITGMVCFTSVFAMKNQNVEAKMQAASINSESQKVESPAMKKPGMRLNVEVVEIFRGSVEQNKPLQFNVVEKSDVRRYLSTSSQVNQVYQRTEQLIYLKEGEATADWVEQPELDYLMRHQAHTSIAWPEHELTLKIKSIHQGDDTFTFQLHAELKGNNGQDHSVLTQTFKLNTKESVLLEGRKLARTVQSVPNLGVLNAIPFLNNLFMDRDYREFVAIVTPIL